VQPTLIGLSGRITLGSVVLTFGRNDDNELVLNGARVSSSLAIISPQAQGYSITDLGSTQRTLVNDHPIPPHVPVMLYPGNIIRFGDVLYTYEVIDDQASTPTTNSNLAPPYQPYEPTVAVSFPNEGNDMGYQQPTPTVSSPYAYDDLELPPVYSLPAYPPTNYESFLQSTYPAYPTPYAPSIPSPVVTAPFWKRRTTWIIGSVLLCLVIVIATMISVNRSTPGKTLDAFCNALQAKDYPTAYIQLSSNRQNLITENNFALYFSLYSTCSHTVPAEAGSDATATISFSGPLFNMTGAAGLVLENGTWKIDYVDTQSTQ
jgi:pSer/pThr/pTyr-binding forkhead associated (FHA) protein